MVDYITRRYTFKLQPNAAQRAALERQCALLARLWNAALEERENQWRRQMERAKGERRGLTYYDQSPAVRAIRADDPEYRAMSSASMSLCLKALDQAFQAFWRRLREGVPGYQAGYPRYKSARRHTTIWHRARASHQAPLSGAGWRLTHKSGKTWCLYAKGIPGEIRARGQFPLTPVDYRSMEIVYRSGHWWMSVVAMVPRRREPGEHDIGIRFSLIDEFARVSVRDGRCAAGSEAVFRMANDQIIPEIQGSASASGGAAPESRGERRCLLSSYDKKDGGAAPESRGERRRRQLTQLLSIGGATPESRCGSGIDLSGKRSRRHRYAGLHTIEDIQRAMARCQKGSWRYRELRRIKAKREAKAARRRRESLHHWTTKIVASADDLTVSRPRSIAAATASGKGNARHHGAAVKVKAEMNRRVLRQAPAAAIQMLEYKAAEAGVPLHQGEHDHTIEIGNALVEATKANRQARQAERRMRRRTRRLESPAAQGQTTPTTQGATS